ncbi:MAG: AAA family ATPase [Planctomycetota bacterium]
MKQIIIIAGPNGAGKTTFAREYLPNEAACTDFINADLIAAGLSPFNPANAALKAGRIMLEEIHERVRTGKSFAFETTLSGLTYARMIPLWRASGYHVTLIFLSLSNPSIAISRVASRVALGGHDIPRETILRRFHVGLANFREKYRPLVDKWMRFDNSDKELVLIEVGHGN